MGSNEGAEGHMGSNEGVEGHMGSNGGGAEGQMRGRGSHGVK